MNEKIQSVLNSLPHQPGVYLMKDAEGTIIYVGKAISLFHRVRSYFQESTDLSPKNRSMVAKIEDIEFLVVKNEVEALVLESNFIKQYRPKYNVLLRDDKNYPYIKVALTENFPRVYRVRSFHRDGNRYFGPYTNSGAVDATLDRANANVLLASLPLNKDIRQKLADTQSDLSGHIAIVPIHPCLCNCILMKHIRQFSFV